MTQNFLDWDCMTILGLLEVQVGSSCYQIGRFRVCMPGPALLPLLEAFFEVPFFFLLLFTALPAVHLQFVRYPHIFVMTTNWASISCYDLRKEDSAFLTWFCSCWRTRHLSCFWLSFSRTDTNFAAVCIVFNSLFKVCWLVLHDRPKMLQTFLTNVTLFLVLQTLNQYLSRHN